MNEKFIVNELINEKFIMNGKGESRDRNFSRYIADNLESLLKESGQSKDKKITSLKIFYIFSDEKNEIVK